MILLNNNTIGSAFLGSTPISKIYKGSDLVFNKTKEYTVYTCDLFILDELVSDDYDYSSYGYSSYDYTIKDGILYSYRSNDPPFRRVTDVVGINTELITSLELNKINMYHHWIEYGIHRYCYIVLKKIETRNNIKFND